MTGKIRAAVLGSTLLTALPAQAATLQGSALSAWWGLPFAALLLLIAFGPLLAPALWHRHYGKLAAACALAFLLPCAALYGAETAAAAAVHAFAGEYLPFILMIAALFVVAGGVCVRGELRGTPALNTGLLALGTLLASFIGTTGASMLMIQPLIRANAARKHAAHIMVFFIFLVANAGGALTPLGDPPLFLGFLNGVDFFWTLKNIFDETLFLCASLLLVFYLLDSHYWRHREPEARQAGGPLAAGIRLEGKVNLLLIVTVLGLVLMSGLWKPGVAFTVMGTAVEWQNLARDGLLIAVIAASLWLTPAAARAGNQFSWEPLKEVAALFAGIFVAIAPVIAMLRAGTDGPFAPLIQLVTDGNGQPVNAIYFWATGLLSALLDNAPTYLVFFHLAGGDAERLMTVLASTLTAISCGAVFMGAATYIGNAPNLMVKAIAEQRGIRMPSFFGYIGWSLAVLLPLLMVMTLITFRR